MAVELPPLSIVRRILEEGGGRLGTRVDVVGPWGSGKVVVALEACRAVGTGMIYLTAGRPEAEAAYEDLSTFAGESVCATLPAWEVLPTDKMAPADDIVAERLDTLRRVSEASDQGKPLYLCLSVRALLQYVVEKQKLISNRVRLAVGEEHDIETLVEKLLEMGYRREMMVEQRGEMSVRGGIFDIFPISAELPCRVEFFGDEIESIRRFEPETQRSIGQLDEIEILPRSEKTLLGDAAKGEGLAPVTEYLAPDTLVVIDEPLGVLEEARKLARQVGENAFYMGWERAREALAPFPQLSLAQLPHDAEEDGGGGTRQRISESMQAISGWTGRLGGFWEQLGKWEDNKYTVILLCNNPGEKKRLLELMEERGFRPGGRGFDLRIELGRLRAGFACETDKLAVLSEREIFGRHYVRRSRRRFEAGEGVTNFSDLRSGDYVVHAVHGIGRYEGMRRFSEKSEDFLAIRYSGGDVLYVPATQIDQVQKYVGADGAVPKIDRLGGSTWSRTKKRIKKAVRDMTEELVKLYAARQSHDGHAFGPDTPWQTEFEDSFEYDETPDQARAIEEVKGDMQAIKPMDRLLCGDVGFGKTEVALRAAFKAVMDGKQVAILVPTTVLAQQHYSTFSERLADYPVRIGLLSRFRSAKEQKEVIEKLKSGEIDIVVGTHRLVSKDIGFKDLGLVVIDEEQHFGVAHKERLKQLRTYVDVLTMTATPIPRTLHMALMGARDLSVINTAPNDRLPIHTCIEAFDEDLVREAIRRELARDGQIFFLHNRVQTILSMSQLIHKLVPEAKIGVAHGQMPEHHLERVMSAFIRREIDVLVSTTIIGSGLDIPNANTILINRADHFGLAELYQLRGRVGRYKHRAFAYLLIPGDRVPTEDADKRLKAMEEFSALGSGYRIAMRDLEIRGCGNILGAEQHGHISAVGYETFMDLIQETVAEIRGIPLERRVLPPFEVAVDAHIPETYVPSETQKITLYKRIAGILRVEEAQEMLDELADRFGQPPGPVKRLIDVMRVRALGVDAGAKSISGVKGEVRVEFGSMDVLGKHARSTLKMAFGDRLEFAWKGTPALTLKLSEGADPVSLAEKVLRVILEG